MGFLSLFVRLIHVFSFSASVVPSWGVGLFWKKYFFEFLIRVRNFTRSRNLLVGFLIWLNQLTFKSCMCKLCARTFLRYFLCLISVLHQLVNFIVFSKVWRGEREDHEILFLILFSRQKSFSEERGTKPANLRLGRGDLKRRSGERGREGRTTAWLEMMLIGWYWIKLCKGGRV